MSQPKATGHRGPRRLRPGASEPLWAQLLADVRRRLDGGEFGDAFPTDRQLMAEYDVSRHTVREAVRHLQSEGLLTRHKGRGSFVQPLALEQHIGPLYSLFRSIEDQGHIQRSEVLTLESTLDGEIAERLGLAPNAPLFHLRRLRRADGAPFAIDEIWMSAALAAPLFTVDFEHTGVYGELDRLADIRPVRGWERIRPGVPTIDERILLGITAGEPVFVVTRYTESEGGPLEWRSTVIRGDSYTFTTTWTTGSTTSQFGVDDSSPQRF